VTDVGSAKLAVVAVMATAALRVFDFDVELDLSRCIRRVSA
jgi:hypothetical protein